MLRYAPSGAAAAGGHFVHDTAQAFQRGASRDVKTTVQVDDQQKGARQHRHQQNRMQAVLHQTLLQLLVEERNGSVIQLVGLRHQAGGLLIKLLPRHVQRFGRNHLIFEQLAALLEGREAGFGLGLKDFARGRTVRS